MKITQNIARIKHLLSLYGMTEDELLSVISHGRKRSFQKEEVFSELIELNTLKRIDKIFNKGLNYYLDPVNPIKSREESIFFRKSNFGTELNLGARKIVNQYEELKISLSAVSKLSEIQINRTVPIYTIKSDPKEVAFELKNTFYPQFNSNLKEFLKSLIYKFAENEILVFEFIETWNKKEKANIDGFFLSPNVIVLKRQQSSFRREIFTLAHEFGHFLLDKEEVEELNISNLANKNLSATERWCNDFAYYFLAGEYDSQIEEIRKASAKNDYCHSIVEAISSKTHLSKIALYTRLLFRNKISSNDYNLIKSNYEEEFRLKLDALQKQKELDKLQGEKQGGSAPKPITSPLLIDTLKTALYVGVINETEFCKTLHISSEKLMFYLK